MNFLEKAARLLEGITATDYNQIFLITTSEYNRQLITVADIIPNHKQRYRIATFAGLLGLASSTGKIINADNVREKRGYFQAVIETQSELVAPILSNGLAIGVLNSESEKQSHYNINMCKAVEQLAAAIGKLLPEFGWSPSLSVDDAPWVKRFPI